MFTTIVCSKCVINKNTPNDTPICIYSKEWPFDFYGVWGLCFLNIFLLPNFMEKCILTLKTYRLNNDPAVFNKKFWLNLKKSCIFHVQKNPIFFLIMNYFFWIMGWKIVENDHLTLIRCGGNVFVIFFCHQILWKKYLDLKDL